MPEDQGVDLSRVMVLLLEVDRLTRECQSLRAQLEAYKERERREELVTEYSRQSGLSREETRKVLQGALIRGGKLYRAEKPSEAS